ncbi:MAG: malonyl-CoA decarboxylase [Pseudomonadota bacterium]|nr:malonyl-CoA decarboxylase [Pseudomonadota bacterium]
MPDEQNSSFLDRTLRKLRTGWQAIAGSSYDEAAASSRPDLPGGDLDRLRAQMHECLGVRGGEVSARARAAALGRVYLALDATGRKRFLHVMAEEFGIDHDAVGEAVDAYRSADGEAAQLEAEARLRTSLVASRVRLLTKFNALPDGVKFLVDMRAELLRLAGIYPTLRLLEQDLKDLLTSWFDIGFLELRRITWDTASASLLEKLIAYEAVHAIESWDDLKNRLDSDRRCFAYFHPRMPDEPLIFVEVALVNGMADNVQGLLDETAPVQEPGAADTAIFYSISNAQKGLAGISFGNFLIKRVADTLTDEFKGLKTFATLSPIPGFVKWLKSVLAKGEPSLLTPAERKVLNATSGSGGGAKGTLKALLASNWTGDEAVSQALRSPLLRLCARYLIEEEGQNAQALDSVAHFHLANGATMGRLNWMGDTSAKGIRQSAGLMINYVYELGRIEENHEAYTSSGKRAVSSGLKNMLKG